MPMYTLMPSDNEMMIQLLGVWVCLTIAVLSIYTIFLIMKHYDSPADSWWLPAIPIYPHLSCWGPCPSGSDSRHSPPSFGHSLGPSPSAAPRSFWPPEKPVFPMAWDPREHLDFMGKSFCKFDISISGGILHFWRTQFGRFLEHHPLSSQMLRYVFFWHHMEVSKVMGVPPVIIHFSGIFHHKPSSYWGSPIYGTPNMLKGQPMTAIGDPWHGALEEMDVDLWKHPSLWLVEHDPSCGKINTYYIYIYVYIYISIYLYIRIYIYHVTICHDISILNHTNRIPILPTWWEPLPALNAFGHQMHPPSATSSPDAWRPAASVCKW